MSLWLTLKCGLVSYYKEIVLSILEAISNNLFTRLCAKLNKYIMQQFDLLVYCLFELMLNTPQSTVVQCLVIKKNFVLCVMARCSCH